MIRSGVSAIFAMGTAAESPMLSMKQRRAALEVLAQTCEGRVPLLVGIMEPSTYRVLELIPEAEAMKAAAIVITAPYYFKVQQKEILKHFQTVREATSLPIVIYNLPAHLGSGNIMDAATVSEIAKLPGVIGYKDSSGNFAQFQQVLLNTKHLEYFSVLQGTQVLSVASLVLGAHGLIPGIGNVIPERMVQLYELVKEGRIEEANEIQRQVIALERGLGFSGYSLASMKAMVKLQGIGSGLPHYPIPEATDEELARIQSLF